MTIKRDLTHMPMVDAPAWSEASGVPPVSDPSYAPALVERWFDRLDDPHLAVAMPEAGPWRGSYAGTCTRQAWYEVTGHAATDPVTVADRWRMNLGTIVHEQLQTAITDIDPDARAEMVLDLNRIGIRGSMRLDLLRTVGDGLVETAEIKTVNGFGFKQMATTFSGPPEGPRDSHIIQAALGAATLATMRDGVVGARIVYLALELLSPSLAKSVGSGGELDRFTAEWFIPLEDCQRIAETEAARWARVDQAMADPGGWVNPVIPLTPLTKPTKIMVVNPKTGAATTTDGQGQRTWQCDYCAFQALCVADHQART